MYSSDAYKNFHKAIEAARLMLVEAGTPVFYKGNEAITAAKLKKLISDNGGSLLLG